MSRQTKRELEPYERADFIRLWISGKYYYKELLQKFGISNDYAQKIINEWQERRK